MRWPKISLAAVAGVLAAVVVWTRHAMGWGATAEEIASAPTAGDWFDDVPGSRARIVRAMSIDAPPETAWPWLAQNGRGAGWYSWEHLDNGARASASPRRQDCGSRRTDRRLRLPLRRPTDLAAQPGPRH